MAASDSDSMDSWYTKMTASDSDSSDTEINEQDDTKQATNRETESNKQDDNKQTTKLLSSPSAPAPPPSYSSVVASGVPTLDEGSDDDIINPHPRKEAERYHRLDLVREQQKAIMNSIDAVAYRQNEMEQQFRRFQDLVLDEMRQLIAAIPTTAQNQPPPQHAANNIFPEVTAAGPASANSTGTASIAQIPQPYIYSPIYPYVPPLQLAANNFTAAGPANSTSARFVTPLYTFMPTAQNQPPVPQLVQHGAANISPEVMATAGPANSTSAIYKPYAWPYHQCHYF